MRNGIRRRRKKKIKTWQVFLILILFFVAISISYAMLSTQLFINGTATGEQEQFTILYMYMSNTSSYPSTIGYMDTYSYTFVNPPIIQSITMGGTPLVLNTDYTYTNDTLIIPEVTGNLVIQGNEVPQNVNVTFNNDGVTNTVTVAQGQTVAKPQDPVKPGYGFLGWADSNDVYFDFTTSVMADITLYAKWMQGVVAEINGTYYQTLTAAIADVPTTNVETTIKILTNINENNIVGQGQSIKLDIQGFTLGNDNGGIFIENNGTIKITNGTVNTSGSSSTINNNSTGTVIISGGNLTSGSGGKSVINNYGGIVEISGSSHLKSATSGTYNGIERATIQNYAGSTLNIKGGLIEDTNGVAISNIGTVNIGIKDGTVNKTNPEIRGKTYGLKDYDTVNFYDGIVKGRTKAFFDESTITEIETGQTIIDLTETISGATYKTAHLGVYKLVTFDANGGTVSETERNVEEGTKIGSLPTPTRTDYSFDGWYTSASGGTEVTADTIITQAMPVYAHWGEMHLAQVSGTKYLTVQAAVSAVPANTQTTIMLLKNVVLTEKITIPSNKNIVFDFQSYTMSASADMPMFENSGTLLIQNGTIRKSGPQAVINNKSGGKLYVTGGNIIVTSTRQAIYNDGGTATISGTANLSATSSERAAVQNHNGTLNIIGGTIVSSGFSAVVNETGKTLNIGTKDGNISTSSPIIQGIDYGISNAGTLRFYDGKIKGITDAFSNTPNDIETNSQIVNGTEQIDGETYKTAHLEISP